MTKTAKLRETLRAAGLAGLTGAELHEKTGIENIAALLSYDTKHGRVELFSSESDNQIRYRWIGGEGATAKAPAKAKRPRKLKGFKAEARERAKRKKTDRVKQRQARNQVKAIRSTVAALAQPVPVVTPAIAGLLDSVDLLCTAVETQVEDVHQDRMLSSAVTMARRAAERIGVQQ